MFTKDIVSWIKESRKSAKFYIFIASILFSLIIPIFLNDSLSIRVLTLMALFTIYASSWNLLATSGQGSLGHAAFLGIGGFTSSLLALNLDIPPIIGVFIGGLFSAGIGFLIGLTCVRLKAWFLGMVTFGFAVITETLVSHFDVFTHGIMGFRTALLVPLGLPFYYLTLFLAISCVIIIYYIMKSKMGLAFRAIHQNEMEAKMIGINNAKYKLYAFVISTFIAGLAGGLYAHFLRYIRVSIFTPANSFEPLMMSVIGGLGTIEGPIIGSIILVGIDSYLPSIDQFLPIVHGTFVGPYLRLLGLGIFLVIVVIFLPKGVSSLLRKIYKNLRSSIKEEKK